MKKIIIIASIIALSVSIAYADKYVLTKGIYKIKTGSYYIKNP